MSKLIRCVFPAIFALLVLLPLVACADIQMDVEQATLRYFIENANPVTGLVRDKIDSFPADQIGHRQDPNVHAEASSAATGFGLTIIANAASRGLIDWKTGRDYFDRLMKFCDDPARMPREHGFFLHWTNWQTGQMVWEEANEFSSIDTAFLVAGALYAAEIFPNTDGARIARKLYRAMDFEWLMTDGGVQPQRRTLSLGFNKKSFIPFQWSIYSEQIILVLLGLGHPDHPLPIEAWTQWERRAFPTAPPFDSRACTNPETAPVPCIVGLEMPLFIHQYSQLFVDLRNFRDGYPNYFETSRQASEFNREVALADPRNKGFWGYSAGQRPGAQKGDGELYGVYDPTRHVSTICIACMLGSAMFMPDVTLHDAEAWRKGEYGQKIWGRYGFTDSLDLNLPYGEWFSQKSLAITVGAEYLSLANTREETSIWRVFNQIPEIARALQRVGHNRPQESASR